MGSAHDDGLYYAQELRRRCHCGKDGHAINSINCPVHGRENDREGLLAEIERLRTALNTARNYIEDEPMVANAVVVREGETVSRDTISAGKHPTLLQVIDDALGINEQNT